MAPLGDKLNELKRDSGMGLGELTVLSGSNDPYRLDTPTNRLNAEWFRERMDECGLLDRENALHLRGIHYAIVSMGTVKMPNGSTYVNNDECWQFLQDNASKAARWLGYVPFDAISDARNTPPVIVYAEKPEPQSVVASLDIDGLPNEHDLVPRIRLDGFFAHQNYKLAIFGEKTSLEDVLTPIASRYEADLYLPSGEISDTLIHKMARRGSIDGREMVVLALADCDPAGYQMAISIAHKLRAFKDSLYPNLNFRLLAPCLTVEQVKSLGLPSTPLKETERRADGWRIKYGVEQTEIDSLLTPSRQGVLEELIEKAIEPYYDETLADRVRSEKWKWEYEANKTLLEEMNRGELYELYNEMLHHLEGLKRSAGVLEETVDDMEFDMPEINLPVAVDKETPAPLVSSQMTLMSAILRLRSRKDYGLRKKGKKAKS